MNETVLLKAVRMRLTITSSQAVNRIEWWTWEPVHGSAYSAVREARSICEYLVHIAHSFEWWTNVPAFETWSVEQLRDRADEIRLKLDSVRTELMRIRDYAWTIGNAADEWLGTPRCDAQPETDDQLMRSRW